MGTAVNKTWTSVGCSQTLCSVPAVVGAQQGPAQLNLSRFG